MDIDTDGNSFSSDSIDRAFWFRSDRACADGKHHSIGPVTRLAPFIEPLEAKRLIELTRQFEVAAISDNDMARERSLPEFR
jgi:hypothetical protein